MPSERTQVSIIGIVILAGLGILLVIQDPYDESAIERRFFLLIGVLIVTVLLVILNLKQLRIFKDWLSTLRIYKLLYLLLCLTIMYLVLATSAYFLYLNDPDSIIIDNDLYLQNERLVRSETKSDSLRIAQYHQKVKSELALLSYLQTEELTFRDKTLIANDSLLVIMITAPSLPAEKGSGVFLEFRGRKSLMPLGSVSFKDEGKGFDYSVKQEIELLRRKDERVIDDLSSLNNAQSSKLSYSRFVFLYAGNKVDSLLLSFVVLNFLSKILILSFMGTIGTLIAHRLANRMKNFAGRQ